MESVIDELRSYHKRQGELLTAYPNANMTVHSKEEYDRNARLLTEIDTLQAAATPAPLADAELEQLQAQYNAAKAIQTAWSEGNASFASATRSREDASLAALNALPGLLARLAAAEAPKWVAVSDRLPIDEIDNHDNPFGTTLYLVARPAAPYVSATALAYRYDGDWFIVQEGAGDDADFVDNSVTHWQSLPAAPAETVKGGPQDA